MSHHRSEYCAMALEPLDASVEERVRASFARQSYMVTIGARMTRLGPGYCEIELDYDERVTQQHKFIHGGALPGLIDSAGGYAGFT